MGRREFLNSLSDALAAAGIKYMVTGSVASAYHGTARASLDIDIVISANSKQVAAFVAGLWEGSYVSGQAAQTAVANRSMFNVIDSREGWKADLIVCRGRNFSMTEFERRQDAVIDEVSMPVATAEDCILSKLEWSRDSGSQVQFQDALGVAVVQYDNLDKAYLTHWAQQLGVDRQLRDILSRARQMQSDSTEQ